MSLVHREQLVDLANTLTAERRLLEQLLFKLIEARLILAADEARFVSQAMAEVETVMERLRFFEQHRTAAVARLADALGEPASKVTLSYLAEWAPEPYRTMFDDHRDHFHRLTDEIEQATVDNRRLATMAVQNLTATLGAMVGGGGTLATYTADGRTRSRTPVIPTQLDEVL